MATIQELFDKTKFSPGELFVTIQKWETEEYFQPYFVLNGFWHGPQWINKAHDNCIQTRQQTLTGKDWQIWKELKAKVKRAQYLIVNYYDSPFTTNKWYKNDAEVYNVYPSSKPLTIQRLEEREFDE